MRKSGRGNRPGKQNSRPHCRRKQQRLSQYFPTLPNSFGEWDFEKERRVTVAIQKQGTAVGFTFCGAPSGCPLALKTIFLCNRN